MPFAARSHLPLCRAPCDPLSSCSFLWSWVQILSESINYLLGWEGISALAVDAEKQGHWQHLTCRKHGAGGGEGGGGGLSVAPATMVQPWADPLLSLAAVPCLQTERTGPNGRFSQLGDMCPPTPPYPVLGTSESPGRLLTLHLPLPGETHHPVRVQLHSARTGPFPDLPSHNILQTDGPATLSTSRFCPLSINFSHINI